MATWQVQQAKSRFSEVLEKAASEGPQTITRHGVEQAVVLSVEEYRRLSGRRVSFGEHLLNFPKVDGFVELATRDADTGHEFDFGDE